MNVTKKDLIDSLKKNSDLGNTKACLLYTSDAADD